MKQIIFIILALIFYVPVMPQITSVASKAILTAGSSKDTEDAKIIHLDKKKFISEIFDYENEKEWKYLGDKPAIIDFYADWCKPCRMVAPTLEELQKEYGTKIQIYKINTQFEQELASIFGITGIPAFLFIPVDGQPSMGTGALPKSTFEQYIKELLKVEK